VVAAEAKGLSSMRVMIRYAARNAVLPSVSGFAVSIGFVVTGQIVMEQVFNYRASATCFFSRAERDYPLMQGSSCPSASPCGREPDRGPAVRVHGPRTKEA